MRSKLPVVFLAFANDLNTPSQGLKALAQEERALRKALEAADDNGVCELVVRSNASTEDVFAVLRKHRYRDRIAIFHFGGHAGADRIMLQSEDGQRQDARASGLAHLLGQLDGLKLVFLNGCSSEDQTRDLFECGVPAVVGTSQAIDDTRAATFAAAFYKRLAENNPLQLAFEGAKAEVETIGLVPEAQNSRDLEAEEDPIIGAMPWALRLAPDCEDTADWTLSKAAGDPLFGLPPLPSQALPDQPFKDTEPFTKADAGVFFGRGEQIRALYETLMDPEGPPVVLLMGQTGVGKTSLLRAGLAPRLGHHRDVQIAAITAEQRPLETLGGLLASGPQPDAIVETWRERCKQSVAIDGRTEHIERLQNDLDTLYERFGPNDPEPLRALRGQLVSLLAPTGGAPSSPGLKPWVLCLDQFEELFAQKHAYAEVRAFEQTLARMAEAGGSRGRIVLCARGVWQAELSTMLARSGTAHTTIMLPTLTRAGILEAIERPAGLSQYQIALDGELSTVIADDLLADRQSSVAPILQTILTGLWKRAPHNDQGQNVLSVEDYQHLQDTGKLLRPLLRRGLASLKQTLPEASKSGLALSILAHHTTALAKAHTLTAEEIQARFEHTEGLASKIIEEAAEHHLLTGPIRREKGALSGHSRLSHTMLAPLIRDLHNTSALPAPRATRILDEHLREVEEGNPDTVLGKRELAAVRKGRDVMAKWRPEEALLVTRSRDHLIAARVKWSVPWFLAVAAIAGLAILATLILDAWTQESVREEVALARKVALQAEKSLDAGHPKRAMLLTRLAYTRNLYQEWTNSDIEGSSLPDIDRIARRLLEQPYLARTLKGHNDSVYALAWSKDDGLIVSGSDDKTIRVWDTATLGKPLHTLKGMTQSVASLALSDNGLLVATGDLGQLGLWTLDRAHHRKIDLEGPNKETLTCGALSPKGDVLVTGTLDGQVFLWKIDGAPDKPTFTLQKSWQTPHKNLRMVRHSPDGTLLLAWSPAKKTSSDEKERPDFSLWSITNPGESLLDGKAAQSRQVLGFDPSGAHLAVAQGSKIRFWRTRDLLEGNRAPLRTAAHQNTVTALAFAKNHLISGSEDHTLKLWKLGAEKVALQEILRGHTDSVRAVAVHKDTIISASSDKTIRVWSVSKPQKPPTTLPGHDGDVLSVVFDLEGRGFASGSHDNTVRLWRENAAPSRTFSMGEQKDTKTGGDVWSYAGMLRRDMIVREGDALEGLVRDNDGDVHTRALAPSSDGKHIASLLLAARSSSKVKCGAKAKTALRLWSPPLGDAPRSLPKDLVDGHAAAFSPDSQRLAVAHQGCRVTFYDPADLSKAVATLEPEEDHGCLENAIKPKRGWEACRARQFSLCFSPDGEYLAHGGSDGNLRVWSLMDPEEAVKVVRVFDTSIVRSCAFDPTDSAMIATVGEDGQARIIDVEQQKIDHTIELQDAVGTQILYDVQGDHLAISTWSGTIELHSAYDLERPPDLLESHTRGVVSIAFGSEPNGARLVSLARDKSARVWNIAGLHARPTVIPWRINAPIGVALSPDGTSIMAWGAYGRVSMWSTTEELMDEMCKRAGRDLSTDEWTRFVGPEFEQEPTCP